MPLAARAQHYNQVPQSIEGVGVISSERAGIHEL